VTRVAANGRRQRRSSSRPGPTDNPEPGEDAGSTARTPRLASGWPPQAATSSTEQRSERRPRARDGPLRRRAAPRAPGPGL